MMNEDVLRRLDMIEVELERLRKVDAGGVWTAYSPTYEGATAAGITTYSLQQGWYLQMGPILFVTAALAWTAATGTGNALFGLPFAPSGTFAFRASGGVRISTVTFTTTTPELIMSASAANFTLESPVSNAVGNVVQIEAAGNITFSLFYGVD